MYDNYLYLLIFTKDNYIYNIYRNIDKKYR